MAEKAEFYDQKSGFESLVRENGEPYWWASDLARLLDYKGHTGSFKKAIDRAVATCLTLEVSVTDNFKQESRDVDGVKQMDKRLTRFACYLVAMNGDPRKPQVAKAQAYFFALAESFKKYIETATDVQRVLIRDELKQAQKTLAGTAKQAGIERYSHFQNAGYVGMYNMSLPALKRYKGHRGKGPLLDFMGKQEMAANLFRITQTDAKISRDNIGGQPDLERAAQMVGEKVRQTMIHLSDGVAPEDLRLASDVKQLRTGLKKTGRELKKIDKKKRLT